MRKTVMVKNKTDNESENDDETDVDLEDGKDLE